MDPKVINIVTHGLGAPLNIFGTQLPGVDQTAWKANAIGGFPEAVSIVPEIGSRFDSRMYVQSNQWNSSDGWVEALGSQALIYSGLVTPGTPAYFALNGISLLEMVRARMSAVVAAEQLVS